MYSKNQRPGIVIPILSGGSVCIVQYTESLLKSFDSLWTLTCCTDSAYYCAVTFAHISALMILNDKPKGVFHYCKIVCNVYSDKL